MQTATVNKPLKVYVAVKADFAADGTMFPRIITWEDGEEYEIDRVSDIRQAPALKAGGQGDRRSISYSGRPGLRLSAQELDGYRIHGLSHISRRPPK